jgi:hypothetical protein
MPHELFNVRVYFNFHKKMISVQSKVNGRWKVVKHVEDILLKNVKFKVSEAGRQRVIKNKRKNVHAYIHGTVIKSLPHPMTLVFNSVNYNPYKLERFQVRNEYVDHADFVMINGCRVYAANDN